MVSQRESGSVRAPVLFMKRLRILCLLIVAVMARTLHADDVHWAYQKPQLPNLELISGEGEGTAIDALIQQRLRRAGLSSNPAANRARALRRLSLDLTGFPPSLASVLAYESGKHPNAWSREADRLLASPWLGERWARHWLDLARYADSEGYQRDELREIWPYRDWVVEAFNRDLPFDAFTIDQLAGDLLPEPTLAQRVATGFHRNATVNLEAGTDPEHDRIKQITDRVNTTGTVWLGTTLACAQCHDHKYDPFSITEYYQLFAYFNHTAIEARQQGDQMGMSNMQYIGEDIDVPHIDRPAELDALDKVFTFKTRVMRDANPRVTHVLKRGEFQNHGTQVHAVTPKALHSGTQGAPSNRLGLARWLVDPNNPLTSRVTVNRFWAEIFGQGLVTTLDDFGTMGERPTHPELLDWLAVQFQTNWDWSMKRLLREMVLSETYRRSSRVRVEAAAADPNNQLLWRHPGHRLDAETIRDQALMISGRLCGKMGGPPVRPYQPDGVWRKSAGAGEHEYRISTGENAWRRGIYTLWRRLYHYPNFATFDAPDRGACQVSRSRSNTPLQALTLLNDNAYFEMAQAFAQRIKLAGRDTLEEQLTWAFRTALSRKPSPRELQSLKNAFHQETEPDRAWENIASILLNLHETICR